MTEERRKMQLPGSGLKCGSCNAELGRVSRTTRTAGFILRERICPECRAKNITSERVIASRERRYFSGNG